MKSYDTDVIVALGAIVQYNQNINVMNKIATNLTNAIKQKW